MHTETNQGWFSGWRRKEEPSSRPEQHPRDVDEMPSSKEASPDLSHLVDDSLASRLVEEARATARKAAAAAELHDLEREAWDIARAQHDGERMEEARPVAELLDDEAGWVDGQALVHDMAAHPENYQGKCFVARVGVETNRSRDIGKKSSQSLDVKVFDLRLYPDLLFLMRKSKAGGLLSRLIKFDEWKTTSPRHRDHYDPVKTHLTRQFRLFTRPQKLQRFLEKQERAFGPKESS